MNYNIFKWVYCLDIPTAILITLLLSILFLVFQAHLGEKRWWKPVLGALLIAFVGAIIYITVGNRPYENIGESSLIPFHSYREVLNGGNREILRSNFMNVLLFYPAGLLASSLLPKKWHPGWRVLLVTVVFAVLSAGIEHIQYVYALGQVEIDDVIHNGAGALFGSICGIIPIAVPNTKQ